jgi:hypothetical protein
VAVCYPMEPITAIFMCIYLGPVQKMFREWVTPTVRFLVIAAPRPSGLPDLDCIQAGLIRGALFFVFEEPLFLSSFLKRWTPRNQNSTNAQREADQGFPLRQDFPSHPSGANQQMLYAYPLLSRGICNHD